MCTFDYFELIRKHALGEKLSPAEIEYLAYVEYTEYRGETSREYVDGVEWDLLLVDYEKIEGHLLEIGKENGKEQKNR